MKNEKNTAIGDDEDENDTNNNSNNAYDDDNGHEKKKKHRKKTVTIKKIRMKIETKTMKLNIKIKQQYR